jgi:hypothetical protein
MRDIFRLLTVYREITGKKHYAAAIYNAYHLANDYAH